MDTQTSAPEMGADVDIMDIANQDFGDDAPEATQTSAASPQPDSASEVEASVEEAEASIFAEEEPEPAATADAEPVFDPEQYLASLEAPDKLTELEPERLKQVAPKLYSEWKQARSIQEAAQKIEADTGIALDFVPDVMAVTAPLLYGTGAFDPETGQTGIQAFMQRLYDYGADPNDPNTPPQAMKQGELYTNLFLGMFGTELAATEQLEPSPTGELPFLVQHAAKPVLKHVLGVEPSDDLIKTLREVAQFGLPQTADPALQVETEAVQATLEAIPDKTLHQYWRRLTPSQQKYYSRESTPIEEVVAALEDKRTVEEARNLAKGAEQERERVRKEQVERVDAEKTQKAEADLRSEVDKIISEGGKLYADPAMEEWRKELIQLKIEKELRNGDLKKKWDGYIAARKQGNEMVARSQLTQVTRAVREIRNHQIEKWFSTKPTKAQAKTANGAKQPVDANGQAQFKPQSAPGSDENWRNLDIVEMMNNLPQVYR